MSSTRPTPPTSRPASNTPSGTETPRQGNVALLHDPVAERLLESETGAHLAYNWRDGTPRCIPVGFFWNGEEVVIGTAVDSPKTRAIVTGSRVALSIEANENPPKVVMIRGSARVDTVEGIAPEYGAMIRKANGDVQGQQMLKAWAPLYPQMTRIFIRPEWVAVLDFETRAPVAVMRAAARAQMSIRPSSTED
jgi:hypothetical protein